MEIVGIMTMVLGFVGLVYGLIYEEEKAVKCAAIVFILGVLLYLLVTLVSPVDINKDVLTIEKTIVFVEGL